MEELNADRQQAARNEARARKRIRDIGDQQAKLLQAHYAGAVPLALLKSEMDRLTREAVEAKEKAQAAERCVGDLEATLTRAMEIARSCAESYLARDTTPAVRRLFNQGLFKALYIDDKGEVERVELTEPFATLLDLNLLSDLAEERESGHRADVQPVMRQDRIGPSAVMSRCFACPSNTNQPDGLVRLGSNKIYLVPPAGEALKGKPAVARADGRVLVVEESAILS